MASRVISALLVCLIAYAHSRSEVQELSDLGEVQAVGVPEAELLTTTVASEAVAFVSLSTTDGAGTCGNGKRTGDEECDDGNAVNSDGCTSACKVEGGYECLALNVGGKDLCKACADTQCTTFFSKQSRCLNTGAAKVARELLQAAQPAYSRSTQGFCECASNFCKIAVGTDAQSFTCKDTSKGWAKKSLTDAGCTCAPGFCSMALKGTSPVQYHCMPLNQNTILGTDGMCACRPAIVAMESSDPSQARPAQPAACKNDLPVDPVISVPGGADMFGTFECLGAPYVKDAASDKCASCATTGSCKMPRNLPTVAGGTAPFMCFVTNGATATATSPYVNKTDGSCECGKDQCLRPNGDHFQCRDLLSAKPYGPLKLSDGLCGCSSDPNVCKLTLTSGFRCVHIAEDNFAVNYRRATDGSCECKESMCVDTPHKDNGALQCQPTTEISPYQRVTGSFQCACKPGSCTFPNGVCKTCPSSAGQSESHCHNPTDTVTTCTKYSRTKTIIKKMMRATAQGQMMSVKKHIAREVGCFIQKTATCTITASAKTCTQTKSVKALYDCPAVRDGKSPMRLGDGTETYGFNSMCGSDDLECQIQNCGRNPDSALCLESAMLA